MEIEREFQQNSLIYYQGPVTVNYISFMGNYLQSLLYTEKKLMQEIFRVFVELAQNVSYFSAETWTDINGIISGSGWFSVQVTEPAYKISTGNLIFKDDGTKLESYCREINSLSVEELRILKRDVRTKAMMNDVIARVGLIQTAIISGSHLEYRITPVDEGHSFFIISAFINRDDA